MTLCVWTMREDSRNECPAPGAGGSRWTEVGAGWFYFCHPAPTPCKGHPKHYGHREGKRKMGMQEEKRAGKTPAGSARRGAAPGVPRGGRDVPGRMAWPCRVEAKLSACNAALLDDVPSTDPLCSWGRKRAVLIPVLQHGKPKQSILPVPVTVTHARLNPVKFIVFLDQGWGWF